MNALLSLVLLAAPPLEVTSTFEAGTEVEVSVVRSDGSVAWHEPLKSGAPAMGPCESDAKLRVVARVPNAQKPLEAERPLNSGERVLDCSATVLFGFRGLEVMLRRFARPPDELHVAMEKPDDVTGFATFVIHNGTREPVQLADLGIRDVPMTVEASDCQTRGVKIESGGELKVSLATDACARANNSAGSRRVTLISGSMFTEATAYEFEFPLPARAGVPPTRKVFPSQKLATLSAEGGWNGGAGRRNAIRLINKAGERVCGCEGDVLGTASHRLTRRENDVCAAPSKGEGCTPLKRAFSPMQ